MYRIYLKPGVGIDRTREAKFYLTQTAIPAPTTPEVPDNVLNYNVKTGSSVFQGAFINPSNAVAEGLNSFLSRGVVFVQSNNQQYSRFTFISQMAVQFPNYGANPQYQVNLTSPLFVNLLLSLDPDDQRDRRVLGTAQTKQADKVLEGFKGIPYVSTTRGPGGTGSSTGTTPLSPGAKRAYLISGLVAAAILILVIGAFIIYRKKQKTRTYRVGKSEDEAKVPVLQNTDQLEPTPLLKRAEDKELRSLADFSSPVA
jgi:hypothetical protein